MNKFVCCGIVTNIKEVRSGFRTITIRDQFRDFEKNKIGIESYDVVVPNTIFKSEKIEIGDTVCCVGTIEFTNVLKYCADTIHPINQLLIHNLLVKFSEQVSAIEEFEREVNAFGMD